jgi:cytidine deaminase
MTDFDREALLHAAMEARQFSYAPFSKFYVGAALLSTDGKIYTGCNIENSAYGPTICAERTAFVKAVSEGQRDFVAIALCGGHQGQIEKICTPCGVCRQVMAEFCKPDFKVYMVKPGGYEERTLAQLLPDSFVL